MIIRDPTSVAVRGLGIFSICVGIVTILARLFLSGGLPFWAAAAREVGYPPSMVLASFFILSLLWIVSGIGLWIRAGWGWWLALFHFILGVWRHGRSVAAPLSDVLGRVASKETLQVFSDSLMRTAFFLVLVAAMLARATRAACGVRTSLWRALGLGSFSVVVFVAAMTAIFRVLM